MYTQCIKGLINSYLKKKEKKSTFNFQEKYALHVQVGECLAQIEINFVKS